MIYLERTITVVNNNASIDEQVILYKGDRNVEIQFIIKNSPFKYKSGIDTTYGQLIINRKKADSLFSNVSKLSNGKVLFVVTGDMIDELNECGDYDFQIRLFNEAQTSRVTLAPITAGISIREPICEGDDPNTEVITPYETYFNFKTKNNTDYKDLFRGYEGTELDLNRLDTSNVTSMFQTFGSCKKLTTINISTWDTSSVTTIDYMFYSSSALTTLDVSHFDASNMTAIGYAFDYCDALVDFKAPKNIGVSMSVSGSKKLSHDSLMDIINNLKAVTSTQTLTLGSTNLAKLSDEEKAIATNKGWTLK